MTRQEEWEMQGAIITDLFAPEPESQPTGVRKLNTRNRGVYNGFTTASVLKLLRKKKGYRYSLPEEKALEEYLNERLANMGCSMDAGTPDWLKYEGTGGVLLAVADAEYAIKGEEMRSRSESDIFNIVPRGSGDVLFTTVGSDEEAELEAALDAWRKLVPPTEGALTEAA